MHIYGVHEECVCLLVLILSSFVSLAYCILYSPLSYLTKTEMHFDRDTQWRQRFGQKHYVPKWELCYHTPSNLRPLLYHVAKQISRQSIHCMNIKAFGPSSVLQCVCSVKYITLEQNRKYYLFHSHPSRKPVLHIRYFSHMFVSLKNSDTIPYFPQAFFPVCSYTEHQK